MKTLLYVLVSLLGIILLLLLVGLALPKTYMVKRSLIINANPEEITATIAEPSTWSIWSVWNKKTDPTVEFEYNGPESGVGAEMSWQGDILESGRLKIEEHIPGKSVKYSLYMETNEIFSHGTIKLEHIKEGTLVKWSHSGDLGNNPVFRWFGFFMDSMLGKDFEDSLRGLKGLLENNYVAIKKKIA